MSPNDALNDWEYLPVLNKCLQIMGTIALGSALRYAGVFDANFVGMAVKFVFHVGLPCLVVKGLGVGVDFYSDKYLWKYIGAFLLLRVISLVLTIVSLFLWRKKNHGDILPVGMGEVAVRWLCLSWISTVIIGSPILSAILNPSSKGTLYGILAGVSSFMLQLPLMLFLLECHAAQKEATHSETHASDIPEDLSSIVPSSYENNDDDAANVAAAEEGSGNKEGVPVEAPVGSLSTVEQHQRCMPTRVIWVKIGRKLATNPVLWGIFFGFLISLSTFGVKFLRPMRETTTAGGAVGLEVNPDYKEWLQFLVDLLGWLGDTVSPISLFVMGVWMQEQGRQMFNINIWQLALFMFSKLVIAPSIMVGLALALDLNDEAGRAAVLIATLPISLASFSLGKRYNIGEHVLAANVATGTLLILPTVLIWNKVLDELGLFDKYPGAS